MKVQEVILRAMAKKITWWQAAEIIGISDRQMRRWRERYEQYGFEGLLDRRRCRPSEKRVPLATVEQVLGLYRDQYFDFNVRHFHEKLQEEHGLAPSGRLTKLFPLESLTFRAAGKAARQTGFPFLSNSPIWLPDRVSFQTDLYSPSASRYATLTGSPPAPRNLLLFPSAPSTPIPNTPGNNPVPIGTHQNHN